ncbi:MAG: hydrogenase maturation protease [Thermodesulfobacteriota bacterium]
MISDLFDKRIVIFGCGNILLGDDGFGPAVIKHLNENYSLPQDVLALDMGTSIRDTLFDLTLSQKRPERLIVIDTVDFPEKKPGEVFEIPVGKIPANKIADFSLHQFPTVNLLADLKAHCHLNITVLVAQMKDIPDEIKPGLSMPIQQAVVKACERIMQSIASLSGL